MDELFFRIAFILIFTSFILIWLRSFFLTGFRKSSMYTMNEGLVPGLSFRIFLTLSIIAILIYLYKPALMEWSAIPINAYVRIIGIPVALSGLLLLISAIQYLGKNFFATLKLREEHELIRRGPYRFLKHPMYVSFVLMWISFFLLSTNWFIGLTGLLTYTIIFIWRVPREEKMMKERFGEDYG